MNTNGKLVLNGDLVSKPHGSLARAFNIVLSEDHQSVQNEDGCLMLDDLAQRGYVSSEAHGKLVIENEVFTFMSVQDSNNDYKFIIAKVVKDSNIDIILKTDKIRVESNNIVYSEYTYNHKKERIIFWSDGIDGTNKPYVLNIDNLNTVIDPMTKDLLVDLEYIQMFTNAKPLTYDVNIMKGGGNLKGGAYYITSRLYYNNDDVTPWDVLRGPFFVGDNADETFNNTLVVDTYGIDSKAVAIEYALVLKSEGVMVAKVRDKYPLDYGSSFSMTNQPFRVSFNNNNGTNVDITGLLVKNSNFTRIGDICNVDDKLYIAGTTEADSFINYQKYANKIVTLWRKQSTVELAKETNCFQDGEVYAFYISWILNSGNQTIPYHIPGRIANTPEEITYCNDPVNDAYHNNAVLLKIQPYDILVANDIKFIDKTTPVVWVKLVFEVDAVEVASIAWGDMNLFNIVSDDCEIIITDNAYSVTVDNGQIKITKTVAGNPSKADNTTYTINPYIRTMSVPGTHQAYSGMFNCQDKDFVINGGYTFDKTGVVDQGIMNYWENKNEYYKSDDTIVYPVGKVRHHRFPLVRNIGITDNTYGNYRNIKLEPIFDNIIIPKELTRLVKGYVISYAKKDIDDKTIFYSQMVNLVARTFSPSNVVAQTVSLFNWEKSTAYVKLINPDLSFSKKSNIITHVMPVGIHENTYWIENPNHAKHSDSLGFIAKLNPIGNAIKFVSQYIVKTRDSATRAVTSSTYKNALVVKDHEFIEDGKNASNLDANDLSFNNIASTSFNKLGIEFNGLPSTSVSTVGYKDQNAYDFSRTVTCEAIPVEITDLPATHKNSCQMGYRHYRDVFNEGGYDDYFIDNLLSKPLIMPNVYGYCQKEDIHFGFDNNKDRVVLSVTPITNADLSVLDNAPNEYILDQHQPVGGDTVKGIYKHVEMMFPFRPLVVSEHPTSPFNGLEKFQLALDKFNGGEQNRMSFGIHEVEFSGIIDARKFFSKSEVNKVVADEGYINKIPLVNPLADKTPYYHKDYNDVNYYAAPIADLNYKNKINTVGNVICESDTANDIRTNVINLRSFRSSNRHYLPIADGAIVRLIKKPRAMYIQQERNLSLAFVKDTLDSSSGTIYTGSGVLFDRPPRIITNNIGEAIKCNHAWHCEDTHLGLCVIDVTTKAIYLVNQDEALAISHIDCDEFFKRTLRAGLYAPQQGSGCLIADDPMRNRILISNVGDWTISFNSVIKGWHCFHDFWPRIMATTKEGDLFGWEYTKVYHHNVDASIKGNYYHGVATAYIDVVCSDKPEVNKIYEAIEFETKVYSNYQGVNFYDKSVDGIMVYTDNQCTGIVDISSYHGDGTWFNINKRNIGEIWRFNEFRDVVVDNKQPFFDLPEYDNYGLFNTNTNKQWFNKHLIISNACAIRFQINNGDDLRTRILNVSVYARKSNVS